VRPDGGGGATYRVAVFISAESICAGGFCASIGMIALASLCMRVWDAEVVSISIRGSDLRGERAEGTGRSAGAVSGFKKRANSTPGYQFFPRSLDTCELLLLLLLLLSQMPGILCVHAPQTRRRASSWPP
jgi:hypothetical protein